VKKERREALEAAGFQVGGIKEFLGLSDQEVRVIDLRVGIGRAIHRIRQDRGLTLGEVGALAATTQPRVARAEAGLPGVTLDQAFRILFALGGDMGDIQTGRDQPEESLPEEAHPVGPSIEKTPKRIKRKA
jgi:hypothetical protein